MKEYIKYQSTFKNNCLLKYLQQISISVYHVAGIAFGPQG